jgi:ABC-2 type transport system permease protein
MIKFWRVISYEYTRLVLRKGFWFGLLSVPGVIVLMVGMILVILTLEMNTTPIGYVDHSGLLANPVPAPPPEPPNKPVPMAPFASEEAAQTALDAGEIQAYYVLAEDYLETANVQLVYEKEPKRPATSQFRAFIITNLLANQGPAIANRIVEGSNLIVRAADGSREMGEDEWFNVLMPIFAAVAFFIAIFTSAGYLMQAVVEEKENRTMEIIVTSVSPNQLMAGKIIGIIGVGLTQLLAWFVFVVLGVVIGRNYFEPLRAVNVSPSLLGTMLLVMLPCFVMLSGLMAAAGATVTEAREGQQIAGLISLPIWLPYFLILPIMRSPNSPLVVAFTLIPITAPMTVVLRIGYTIIPAWQIAASVTLLVLSAAGSLWLAGRTFRLGMLMYGQRLRWRQVFSRE